MAKVFSTHPPTEDRIVTAQKNIEEMLKARPEYVVTTSEFGDVKGRPGDAAQSQEIGSERRRTSRG